MNMKQFVETIYCWVSKYAHCTAKLFNQTETEEEEVENME